MCKGVHESLALNVKCLEKAIVETQEAISVTAVVHANEAMHGGAEISQVQGALAGARALRQGVNIIGNASRVSAELAMDHTKEAEHGEAPITSEPLLMTPFISYWYLLYIFFCKPFSRNQSGKSGLCKMRRKT